LLILRAFLGRFFFSLVDVLRFIEGGIRPGGFSLRLITEE